MQFDALLLAAKFMPFVPKIASNIQYWVSSNLNVSNKQLEDYIKTSIVEEKSPYPKREKIKTKLSILCQISNFQNFQILIPNADWGEPIGATDIDHRLDRVMDG